MPSQLQTPSQHQTLCGATAIVTGASDGIGAVTARELARAGARVVLAVRNPDKAHAVAQSWPGQRQIRHLDLADLESVRAFAAGWQDEIDLLINNAGLAQTRYSRTRDGFEAHIGVNHLGHFALTQLLLPHITGRIVTVSSDLHKQASIDIDDLNWERRGFTPYGRTATQNWRTYCLPTSSSVVSRLPATPREPSPRTPGSARRISPGTAAAFQAAYSSG